MSLDFLEAASFTLAPLALALAGHFSSLATNVRFYKPVKTLLSKLASTDSLPEILAELDEELVMLACHRFGHTVVVALLEAKLPLTTRESLVERFLGRIAELACHPVCCAVVEVLLTTSGDGQQAEIIEEVCTVTANQADMAVVSLTKDKQGHAIVLTMLKVETISVITIILCSGVSAQASAQSAEGFHLVQAGRAGGQRLGGQGPENHQDGVPQQSLNI